MEKKYHGIIPPIISPVDKNEDIDEKGFRKLIDYCIDGGLTGIFVVGSNGETMALTQKERTNAIRIAVDQAGGRIPVMCGVMDTSTRRVIDNIKAMQDVGGNCAVITPVFYDRHTSQDETVRHFEDILKCTDCELVLYNIPLFTGIKLTPATASRILDLDKRVVAYKDTGGAFGDFLTVLEKFRDTDKCMLQGSTAMGMASLLLGADGFIPAMGTAFPRMFADAYEAGKSKNCELAWEYDKFIRETSRILGMSKNATAAAKYAISLRGFTSKDVIRPQDTIQPTDEEKIRIKVGEIDAAYAAFKTRGRR